LGLEYILIGGIAVGLWSEPRATLDVDLSLWVEPSRFESTITELSSRLRPRSREGLEAPRTRVLPVHASNGVHIDFLLAAWPIERNAIENGVPRSVAGKSVRVATLDYLLFLKLISERPKDLVDAGALIRYNRSKIDAVWLEKQLGDLAESTAEPEMLSRFQRLIAED
jgi:hypothetical protein